MAFSFDTDSHTYTLDGRKLPSVTTIIDSCIPSWKAGPEHLARGTKLHELCRLADEDFLGWDDIPPLQRNRVMAWKEFRHQSGAVPVLIEQPLVSARLMFAGTVDRTMTHERDLLVCDLKSTITPSVILQLGGYAILAAENGHKVTRGVAVQLNDDSSYKTLWLNRNELAMARHQFLAALTLFNFKTQHNLLEKRS